MKTIEELDDVEAVYSLYLAAEPHGHGVNLDNPETVKRTVREAFASAAAPALVEQVMARLADESTAAEVARAALGVLREDHELVPGVSAQIGEMLADPPRADRLDMGFSLALLTFGALAMALMGTLEFKSVDELEPGGGRRKTTVVNWKGSQNIPKLVAGILGKLGLDRG